MAALESPRQLDSSSSHPGYRADIDGLRGVAVAAVVLFHLKLGAAGGYVGVDVFFVISGFLITRLILAAQQEQRFSLRNFWQRRLRRLAPAAIVMVTATLLAGAWLMLPRDYYHFSKSVTAQVLLASNVYFHGLLDYFAGPADQQPLLHTWSLAVEEQFYLVFPLLLVWVRHWPRRRLLAGLCALTAASLALSVSQVANQPSAAFFLLPGRAWELLVGALLVFVPRLPNAPAWRWELLSVGGVAAIGCSIVLYNEQTLFPGIAALPPVVGAAAIILANSQCSTAVARALAWQPLVALGLMSYSLYLWHWPVISLLHYQFGATLPPEATALALVSSCLLGYLSWRWVETPIRTGQLLSDNAALLRAAAFCLLLIVGASTASLMTRGLPMRWGADVARAFANSKHKMGKFRTGNPRVADQDRLPRIGLDDAEAPSVLIWGDSHAAQIGQLCDDLAHQYHVSGYVASHNGFTPLVGVWRWNRSDSVVHWSNSVVDFVRRHRIQHVVLVSRWAGYLCIRENGKDNTLLADEQSRTYSRAESKRVLDRGLHRTVRALEDAGARVWLMKQIPAQTEDPLAKMIRGMRRDATAITGVSLAEHQQHTRDVNEVFAALPTVTLIDPARHCFDEQHRSRLGTSDHSYYIDTCHLSTVGAETLVRPALEPVFAEIAGRRLAGAAPTATR
ncbi:MAG: acyltransferase [Planctomycetales bacterium]|nr:acyltransferase [Planctomycetales bacterium]